MKFFPKDYVLTKRGLEKKKKKKKKKDYTVFFYTSNRCGQNLLLNIKFVYFLFFGWPPNSFQTKQATNKSEKHTVTNKERGEH